MICVNAMPIRTVDCGLRMRRGYGAVLHQMRAGQPGGCRRQREALGARVIAAMLVFCILLIAGESQACLRGASADATGSTQVTRETTTSEPIGAPVVYRAAVPGAALAGMVANSSDGAGCCGKCPETNCSWCSATLPPEILDIGRQLTTLTLGSTEQASLLILAPSSIFRPPRMVA